MSSSTVSELDSLPGLDSAKRLVRTLAGGSVVQAVLFYGLEGSGKSDVATVLTKAWLCTNPSQNGACGECQACKAFERNRSVDVLPVQPVGPSEIIRLDAMVDVEQDKGDYPIKVHNFLRTPPLSARSKVVVILQAERLNSRAANSLLKILEEPPTYGRFILLTDSVGSILPTILSRCVAVPCEVSSQLDGFDQWAIEIAGNAPHRAHELSESAPAYRAIYEFARTLDDRPKGEALVASEEFAALADALQTALGGRARAADAEALEVLAAVYSIYGRHPDAVHAMVEAHRRIIGNANASSTLDALFASILR